MGDHQGDCGRISMTMNLQLLEGFQGMDMTVLLDNFYFTRYSLVTKTIYVEGGEKMHSYSLRSSDLEFSSTSSQLTAILPPQVRGVNGLVS